MPSITALLHTNNDALRLGRALETLYACDDILIIDHSSRDATLRVARDYGARVINATFGTSIDAYLRSAPSPWILSLDPCESLSESLSASLFEWKSEPLPREGSVRAFSVFLREETPQGWVRVPTAQTRLIARDWTHWQGTFPLADPSAAPLSGELLRFVFP
jgi:glycosyltransferase involved in cell wall biosynthesis